MIPSANRKAVIYVTDDADWLQRAEKIHSGGVTYLIKSLKYKLPPGEINLIKPRGNQRQKSHIKW